MKTNSQLNSEIALSLHDVYKKAYPYPHISIDNFIPIEDIRLCVKEIEAFDEWGHDYNNTKFQDKKDFFPWNTIQTESGQISDIEDTKRALSTKAPVCWKWLSYFNSEDFLKTLENLTGIKDLIPDWGFAGGGLHSIESGGKLSIHSDYNKHPFGLGWRRINLLVYLNEDWQKEWGGTLQIWKKDMSQMISEYQPYAGKAIIFNTTDDALHGHPKPLNSPEGKNRYSFALYYFSKDRPDHEKSDFIGAQWYGEGNSLSIKEQEKRTKNE
mgnify:CR=1 FL=1